MEDVLNSVKSLSIAELREQLIDRGHKVGPVTTTTKGLFQRKLANLIYKDKYGDVSGNEAQIESKSSEPANRPPEKICVLIGEEVPSVYYGIALADGDTAKHLNLSDDKLVFTDKTAAFAVAKEHPGSRFKVFKTYDEALDFVKKSRHESSNRSLTAPPSVGDGGDPGRPGVVVERSVYKAPKMRDLVVLRGVIEGGDEHRFTALVWGNPRYLVSSGDTPVILHEGQRYNALHTAAKANQPAMCRLVLETILDPEFTRQLYDGTSDSDETQARRVQFLADLYLNMPDRGNGESPLHFACKFGFPDVVEVLVGYSSTDRNMKNKYGDTPQDIICSRCQSPSKDVQNRITELLQGVCYVPLLRSTDNTSAPLIGQPWSPDQSISPVMQLGKSPIDPQLTVRARAGPMSPSKAHLFYRHWSSPLSHSPVGDRKTVASIKREDGDKGLERIGRQLAHEMRVPWLEYWEFLDAFVDLGTESGVSELERHLKKQQSALTFTQCLQNIDPRDIRHTSPTPQTQPHPDLGASFMKQHSKSLIHASSFSASGASHLQQTAAEASAVNSSNNFNEIRDDEQNHVANKCESDDGQKLSVCDDSVKNGLDHLQTKGSGSVKNGLDHVRTDGSQLCDNLTSTPKADTWSYRQHRPSGEQDSPETRVEDVSCESSPGDTAVSGQSNTHIRASLFNTPDSNMVISGGADMASTYSHADTVDSGGTNMVTTHSETHTMNSGGIDTATTPSGTNRVNSDNQTTAVTSHQPSCMSTSGLGDAESSGYEASRNSNQSLLTDGSDSLFQRREENRTPDPWTYRRQSSETEHVSPITSGEINSPAESGGLSSVSNSDENSILISLSNLKLSNGEGNTGMSSTSSHNESEVFASPKTAELSFNSNLKRLCSDFEAKLMFTPESTKLCSASPSTMPYGQITLNLGNSHHAVETFRRLSDLKVTEDDDDYDDDLLSHNAPVIVLIKHAVPQTCNDHDKPVPSTGTDYKKPVPLSSTAIPSTATDCDKPNPPTFTDGNKPTVTAIPPNFPDGNKPIPPNFTDGNKPIPPTVTAIPPTSTDCHKPEIVVDVWVTKDRDLKSSVNHVFPDLVVGVEDRGVVERLLGLDAPRLVTVDVTCEERYTLRQHTVPVQALFIRSDHEANSNIHILGLRHSKADLDVYRAVKDTPIDASKFPLTHRWLERMAMLAADTKQSWPSPSRLRSEARMSKNTSCLSPLVTSSPAFRARRLPFSPLGANTDPRTVLFPPSPRSAASSTQ